MHIFKKNKTVAFARTVAFDARERGGAHVSRLLFPLHCLFRLFSFHCQSFSTVHKIGPDCSMYFYWLERASVLAFVYISFQATV